MTLYSATYSPDDNKLRLYASSRLDEDLYHRVRAEGFRWAPKQDLFVAPAWSPAREDLLLELCGAIDDEDTSLVERSEERAERFEGYQENRAADAESARAAVKSIADGIPMGQPILVGHHSEKHARRDAKRIENGMRRAIKMWETSKYWQSRAAGAIAAAKYKLRPEVRARRIKRLEAERRKLVRDYTPDKPDQIAHSTPWHCPICGEYSCDHPKAKVKVPHVYCGASRGGSWVPVESLPAIEARNARPIAHLDRRLEYERAMLEAEGNSGLLDKPKRPKAPPLLNYRAESIEVRQKWGSDVLSYPQKEMTKAEYKKAYHEDRWTVTAADGSHRIRYLSGGPMGKRTCHVVFLTDSKEHPRPEPQEPEPTPIPDKSSGTGVRTRLVVIDAPAVDFAAVAGAALSVL